MKNKVFFKITKCFLFAFMYNISYSQIPATPNVASLFKINPTSVNESTGTANVSIPLYNINLDGLVLPILLSYNSNGITVEAESSNAGTGWTLLMGGVVSRRINGQPDEFSKQVINELDPPGAMTTSYFNPNTGTFELVPCARFTIKSNVGWLENSTKNINAAKYFLENNGDMTNFTGAIIDNVFIGDNQPDIFNYILPTGRKGSFMLLNFGNENIVSSTNDKIQVKFENANGTSNNSSILSFIIADEYGNSYIFDIVEQRNDSVYGNGFGYFGAYYGTSPATSGLSSSPTMTLSSPVICPEGGGFLSNYGWFNIAKKPINMSWHISKITTNKSNTINFNYEDEYYNRLNNDATIYKEDFHTGPYLTQSTEDIFTSKKLINIKTPLEYLVINYEINNREDVRENNKPSSLKAYKFLQIFDKDNNQFKRIDFITSYKISPGENLAAPKLKYYYKRLYLDEIKINNNEIYHFEYNSNSLPHKHSFEQDYWGYYNANNAELQGKSLLPDLWYYPDNVRSYSRPGKFSIYKKNNFIGREYKISTIPKYANKLSKYVANRDVNELALKNGILEKIIYPTKGYEKFIYESNDFMYEGDLKKGFGLRVSKIETYNSDNTPLSQVIYNYKTINGNSSGVITNLPAFGKLYSINVPYEDGVQSHFSSNSYSFNSELYYNRVEKSYLNNGKIVTDFLIPFTMDSEFGLNLNGEYLYKKNVGISKFRLPATAVSGNFIAPLNTAEFTLFSLNNTYGDLFGKALKVSIYDKNNKLISTTENQFNLNNKSTKIDCFIGKSNSLLYDNYTKANIFAEFELTNEKQTMFYDNNTSITNETVYTYNNNLLTTVIKKNSQGKDQILQYKYPSDFTYRNTSFGFVDGHWFELPISNVYGKMVDKNMINYPVETVLSIDNKVISSEVTTFKEINYSSAIVPYELKKLEKSYSLSNYTFGNINWEGTFVLDPQMKNEMYYDSYDSSGNLTMYHKANGIYVTILWGYNKTYPIAKIENAHIDDVASKLGVNTYTLDFTINENSLNQINLLRSVLPNAMVTTYTYKPLIGVSTITDPKGDKITYEYDEFNRLKQVKDKNGNILSENEYHYRP